MLLLLPPIARSSELQPALELLDRGETIYVALSIARPERLPYDIVWCDAPDSSVRGELRRVRRKTARELRTEALFERHGFSRAPDSLCAGCG